jgi:tripartite-type tricarboxylate transporter receptor subunit TctC
MKLRLLALTVTAGLMTVPLSTQGKEPASYPVRPIRLIVPTTPSAPPDIVARVIGEKLAAALGQPVVVDNRPGAMGSIGLEAMAKAAADGYTLGVIGMPFIAVTPKLLPRIPYDTTKDFAPVALVAWNYNILTVPAVAPVKSVAHLIAAAKAKPGALRFSSGGNGTPAHLASELLKREANIDIMHVPYKGAAAAVTAMLTGEVDMMIGFVGAVSPYIKTGRLRALATSAPKRISAYPELPTFVELGYPRVQISDWQGVFAPRGTPGHVMGRLHVEIAKATAMAEVKERLEAMGMEVARAGPQEAAVQIRSDIQQWSQLIRDVGIKAD